NALKSGVAAGMSGSPVYVDGRLIGALSYAIGSFTKEPIGGVTPIEQMLKIVAKEESRDAERLHANARKSFPVNVSCSSISSDIQPVDAFLDFYQAPPTNRSQNPFTPIQIPFTIGNSSGIVPEKVAAVFAGYGLQLVAGGGSGTAPIDSGFPPLAPGSPVAVLLVDGDISMAGTGTVTAVNKNSILAFGHPFMGFGPIHLPMAKSKILMTIPSLFSSYKMAQAGPIVGGWHQDRSTGILGVLADTAPMIPVHITYRSELSAPAEFDFRIAADASVRNLSPLLMFVSIMNIIESARMNGGDFHTRLQGELVLPAHENIQIDNFYSGLKTGAELQSASVEPAMLLATLVNNSFLVPEITEINLTLESAIGHRVAGIQKIWVDQTQAKAGDSLNVHLFIRQYGTEDNIHLSVPVFLPADLKPGNYGITVGSAGFLQKLEKMLEPNKYRPHNFDQLIELMNHRRANNEIVFQLRQRISNTLVDGAELPYLPPSVATVMSSPQTSRKTDLRSDVLVWEKRKKTDWVVSGGKYVPVVVTAR
ncbi:hypothetical protein KAH55_07390, partial [bacterium]|nr:hypothetical protein [bacterium]